MKLSQKRNCNGCRALTSDMVRTYCSLGIKIKTIKEWHGIGVDFRPLKECYKPLTVKNLVSLMK